MGVRRILVVPRDSGGASTGFCWCIWGETADEVAAPCKSTASPDSNLTPLAAFLRFCRAQRGSDRTVLEIRGWTATREINHIEA